MEILDNCSSSSSSSSSGSYAEEDQQLGVEIEPVETEIEISDTSYPMLAKPFERSSMKIRNMKDTPLELKLYIDDRSIRRNYFYFVIENDDKATLVMTNTTRLNPAEEMKIEIMYVPQVEHKERFGFIVLYSNDLQQILAYPVFGTGKSYDYPPIEERTNPYNINSEE